MPLYCIAPSYNDQECGEIHSGIAAGSVGHRIDFETIAFMESFALPVKWPLFLPIIMPDYDKGPVLMTLEKLLGNVSKGLSDIWGWGQEGIPLYSVT